MLTVSDSKDHDILAAIAEGAGAGSRGELSQPGRVGPLSSVAPSYGPLSATVGSSRAARRAGR
jgi:hypothetical protein